MEEKSTVNGSEYHTFMTRSTKKHLLYTARSTAAYTNLYLCPRVLADIVNCCGFVVQQIHKNRQRVEFELQCSFADHTPTSSLKVLALPVVRTVVNVELVVYTDVNVTPKIIICWIRFRPFNVSRVC